MTDKHKKHRTFTINNLEERKMKWVTKSSGSHGVRKTDVKITLNGINSKDGKIRTRFSILNSNRFFDTEFIAIGYDSNLIYFKPDVKTGFKIYKKGKVGQVNIMVALQNFIGEYDMKYDQNANMYYIDRREKIVCFAK